MITSTSIEFGSRLGNSMFKLAAVIGMAIKNNMDYAFPAWSYQDHFKNKLPLLPHTPMAYNKYNEKHFHYEHFMLDKAFNWDLEGFWQSDKYWYPWKEIVLPYFEFNDDLIISLCMKYSEVLSLGPVAIHVRRGDYISIPDILPVLPLEYYNKAVAQFDKAQHFLVFSDDIDYVKKHFIGHNFTIIEGNTDVQDLCLMTLCTGFVLANSSYSWWGSTLSKTKGKKIVAPKKTSWFGKGVNHDVRDLYNDNWILI